MCCGRRRAANDTPIQISACAYLIRDVGCRVPQPLVDCSGEMVLTGSSDESVGSKPSSKRTLNSRNDFNRENLVIIPTSPIHSVPVM